MRQQVNFLEQSHRKLSKKAVPGSRSCPRLLQLGALPSSAPGFFQARLQFAKRIQHQNTIPKQAAKKLTRRRVQKSWTSWAYCETPVPVSVFLACSERLTEQAKCSVLCGGRVVSLDAAGINVLLPAPVRVLLCCSRAVKWVEMPRQREWHGLRQAQRSPLDSRGSSKMRYPSVLCSEVRAAFLQPRWKHRLRRQSICGEA